LSTDTRVTAPPVSDDARLLGRALAGLRIFIGLIALLNGLAKLFGWRDIRIGPFVANLINRDDARFILDFEVNKNPAGGEPGTKLPLLPDIATLMLDNWGLVGWSLTALEIGTGLLLVLGLGTRAAALAALGMHLFLALVYFSSDRWLFEQPHEYVPLVILALVPAGRVWGLDAWAARRTGRTGPGLKASWPF
jgi:uncharacterized membrane protein YphA (DoxX/SURF4 family)